ncbi:hypothetical protein [Pygmaiobacter massiliensis]|uniref:hypothetical protein n=1 Tax=Pygmaiobacter massiliensis TaxID=1917873 RepID=UPI000C7A2964|nr:hypothetical protein [Pygmaiobacter massiliensis]
MAQEKVPNPVSKESKAYKAFDKGQQRLEEAQTGLSNDEKFAYGVGTSVAQNAAMLPMEAVVLGSGIAMMGALSAADTVREETEKGAGASKAMGRALASGLIEAGIEKIGLDTLTDVVKGSNKSAVKNIIKKGFEKAAGAAGGEAVANMLSEMTAEGLEEVAGHMANYAVDKVSKEPDAEFSWIELLQNFAAGALAGGILGACDTAVNTLQNKKQQNAIELQNQIREINSLKKEDATALFKTGIGINADPSKAIASYESSIPQLKQKAIENMPNAEMNEQTQVNDNPETHTAQEMKIIAEFKNSVDSGLVEYFNSTLLGKAASSPYVVSSVSSREAQSRALLIK